MTLVLGVMVELWETFLRLLQPNSLAAFCWLISVVSAFLTHPSCLTTIHHYHTSLCCLLSFPLSGSAGFIFTNSFQRPWLYFVELVVLSSGQVSERKVDQK